MTNRKLTHRKNKSMGKRNQELETENKTHRQTSKQKHRKADIHTDNVWMWS